MRRPSLRWLICAFLLTCATFGSHSAAQTGSAPACASPEYHQFDFWIGNWDIFDVDDPKTVTAHARVESILDGCVLKETYEGANGVNGQSFSIFDRTRGVWHQSWVTSHGQLLVIEGKLTDGNMVLIGADKSPDGKDRLTRGTWIPLNGYLQETAVRSIDGGKTWQPWFDLIFKPTGASRAVKPD